MNEVFADSFYFIALLHSRDRYHAAAVELSRRRPGRLVTTHWVLIELADALCAPAIRARSHQFIASMLVDPNVVILSNLDPWFRLGLELFASSVDKSWSLTDCISFTVMEARGIREALTADRHFTQAGFMALLDTPQT